MNRNIVAMRSAVSTPNLSQKSAVKYLRGAVLDAFRAKITERLPVRAATTQSSDSPGAMINRLRNPVR